MKYRILLPLIFLIFAANGSCEVPQSANSKERNIVNQQQELYVNNQPVPVFDWSLERHLMTELYKARNNAVSTYSYIRNQYTGKILSSCPSIGFPISAATQLTNPQAIEWRQGNGSYTSGVISQPEPNGMFSPPESRGTYVMCVNEDGQVEPRYYEEDVETYVTPMQEVDGQLVKIKGAKATITINPKR